MIALPLRLPLGLPLGAVRIVPFLDGTHLCDVRGGVQSHLDVITDLRGLPGLLGRRRKWRLGPADRRGPALVLTAASQPCKPDGAVEGHLLQSALFARRLPSGVAPVVRPLGRWGRYFPGL